MPLWVLLVILALVILVKIVPIPFVDRSATTLVMPTLRSQVALAKSLAKVIGKPTATLDTKHVQRFLYRDGTSVDWLAEPSEFTPMYNVVALKTIVIGFFRSFFVSPLEEATKIRMRLEWEGHRVQIVDRPDHAFPPGSIVLVLSEVFVDHLSKENLNISSRYGAAILIRRHAFRVGGKRPKIGSPF